MGKQCPQFHQLFIFFDSPIAAAVGFHDKKRWITTAKHATDHIGGRSADAIKRSSGKPTFAYLFMVTTSASTRSTSPMAAAMRAAIVSDARRSGSSAK